MQKGFLSCLRSVRWTALVLLMGVTYAYGVTSLGRSSGIIFDSEQYFLYGRNLVTTGTYGTTAGVPDMNREPGYGLWLAGSLAFLRATGLVPDLATAANPDRIFWVRFLQAALLFWCAWLCAFHAGLAERLRRPLFFLAILSPTTIGAAREIYSEALSIPLSFLLLFLLARSLQRPGLPRAAGLSFGQAAVVLTKSYLFPFSLLALAFSPLLWFRKNLRIGLWLALPLAIGGVAAQKGWDARNRALFGEGGHEARKSIAVAGKVARLDRADWARDWPVALAASLGTNFCDQRFGADRCTLYDYRGCDVIGNQVLVDYRNRFGMGHEADRQLQADMLKLWFQRPFTQLAGSALELLRMFFFEAVLDATTLPAVLQHLARAWHIAGSLLLWGFIFLSWTTRFRGRAIASPERPLLIASVGLILYHVAAMSQITNVVRYVFPVLPFLYLFAADGIATALKRIPAGKR